MSGVGRLLRERGSYEHESISGKFLILRKWGNLSLREDDDDTCTICMLYCVCFEKRG